MRIVFTGGGTGGHFFPLLAVARELKKIAEEERILGVELYFLGPEARFGPPGLAVELLRQEDIVFSRVASGKFRRYFSLKNIFDLIKLGWGVLQSLWKMFLIMPDVVFAKGGYGSFPTLLASLIYRIPVVIHASDAVPGLVERWAGKWVKRVAISFPDSARFFPAGRTAFTGNPIRKKILFSNKDVAHEIFGLYSNRPVILVMGASQGSKIINETVTAILTELLKKYEIIHQTGEANREDVTLETMPVVEKTGKEFYHLAGFLDEKELAAAYQLADIILSRASAGSIFEIAASAKPAILIPLKNSAQDHQRANAYEYSKTGGAVVIEEDNLTPTLLLNEITKLTHDSERRNKMSQAAKSFSRPEAADIISRELLTLGLH